MTLFLDDDPKRIRKFLMGCPSATCVSTASDCIDQLRRGQWADVHLDHDLEGVFQNSDSPNCGMEVVRWVRYNAEKVPKETRFTVHSLNAPAAVRMVKALRSGGYTAHWRPFGASMGADQTAAIEATCDPESVDIPGAVILKVA